MDKLFAIRIVTACHFLTDGPGAAELELKGADGNSTTLPTRVVLFVCTLTSIVSYKVGELGGVSTTKRSGVEQKNAATNPDHLDPDSLAILSEDRGGSGCDFHCSTIFESIKTLLVARTDGIFAYDPDEGNLSATPLPGDKFALSSLAKAFFGCVASEGGGGMEPGVVERCRVTICLSYPHVRFVAFSALFGEVRRLFPGFGDSLFVLDSSPRGGLFRLREKPKSEQVQLLLRKRMFDWAAKLAERENLPAADMREICRAHGDALFEKRLYDQALTVYMRSLDYFGTVEVGGLREGEQNLSGRALGGAGDV